MIFYIYDEKTKEYRGTQNGFIDPLETKKQGKNVYLVPAGISVDSANVFNTEERPVNPYSEETEKVAVDAVHPSPAGYYQIADTIYSTLCGTMENW